jgi:hypothetical protein
LTRETWDLVNQLTHAKNAGSYDAEIGVAAVSHFISTMTAARVRWSRLTESALRDVRLVSSWRRDVRAMRLG